MNHRHQQPCITVVRDPSIGIIPRQKGRQDGKEPTSLDQIRVRLAARATVEVSNPQEENADVDDQEEREEGDSGFQGAEEHEGGEDEPALDLIRVS